MRIHAILIVASLCAIPAAALAAKVAIAPVQYVQVQAGEAPEAARQVEDKVADGARQAGYEVVRGAAVADAGAAAPACAAARDRACLEAVAEALGVDEAIGVAVTDDDHTSYRVEVTHARRDKVVDERTAGFFVVLEWVRGAVAIALQKPVAPDQPDQPDQADRPDQPAPPDGSDGSDRPDRPDQPAPPDRRPIRPPVFWTAVGVTGALIVTYAAVDIATYAKYRDLKDAAAPGRDDWDAARRLQVADRALLGFAIAAAAATTAMWFFTDFEEGGSALGAAPVPLAGGGGLAIEGRF